MFLTRDDFVPQGTSGYLANKTYSVFPLGGGATHISRIEARDAAKFSYMGCPNPRELSSPQDSIYKCYWSSLVLLGDQPSLDMDPLLT